MTVRVAVDASCLAWGQSGTRRYTELVLQHMARDERVELHLITNAPGPVADIAGVRETPCRQRGAVLWRARVLVPVARRTADVLWCPWLHPPALPVGIPMVLTVHDLSPVLHGGTKPWREVVAMRTTGRWGVRRAAHIVTVSRTTKDDLETHWGVPASKVTAVPLTVDPLFTPGDRTQSAQVAQDRWGLIGPFALAVGTIEPRKGYDLLPALAAVVPELPLVVVGRPGPRSAELLPSLATSCTVLPPVDEDGLLHLYRAAEVLLAPSVYEGFGLTPMEAMACGTPAVVAAGAGSLEEIYAGTARVVERRPGLWAAAIRDVVGRREEHAARGLALARSRSWDDVAREVANVLVAVAGRPSAQR